MKPALDALCAKAEKAVRAGINIIILSDRMAGTDRIPMPSLLACAAVHHHLIRQGLRTSVGLVVESAEPREVHHFSCLAGYGAEAINPYLAFETLIAMHDELPVKLDKKEIIKRYIKSVDKGLLKVMSKMGISTYQSYCGAQIFDAVGLEGRFRPSLFHRHRHPHRRRGARRRSPRNRCAAIATRSATRRSTAACSTSAAITPCACAARITCGISPPFPRCSTRCAGNSYEQYRAFAKILNEQSEKLVTIRGLFRVEGRGGRRAQAGAAGRSGAGEDHRAALLDRRHVVRLHLARSAYHARHRHEPDRRQVEHRRRRRGSRPLQAAAERRFHALGDQAGGVGALRRHRRVSRQLGHDADQDGARRQARRRRPTARAQGGQDHRPGAPFDAGRRPDLAAAAPRHLFDRGSGAADLRPQERQSGRRGVGEARLRSRRRHGGGGRVEGALRSCHHRGLRRRHRRLAADLDQARG